MGKQTTAMLDMAYGTHCEVEDNKGNDMYIRQRKGPSNSGMGDIINKYSLIVGIPSLAQVTIKQTFTIIERLKDIQNQDNDECHDVSNKGRTNDYRPNRANINPLLTGKLSQVMLQHIGCDLS